MGTAARGFLSVALIALLGLAGGASAQTLPAPIPPVPTPDVPDLPGLPNPTVPPVPSPGPTGQPPVGSPIPSTGSSGGSGGSAGSSATSGSGGGGEAGSRASRARTRFDRLPRRFEVLLERIELGRHPRASLLRLERLLTSVSPALRARILRVVRAEIARLRDGGLTAAERRRVQRLQPVIDMFAGGAGPSTRSSTLEASPTVPAGVKEAESSGASVAHESPRSSQVLPLTGTGPLPPRESGSSEESGQSTFGLESPGWEVPLGVYLAFAVLLVLSLGALALAAAPPQALPAGRVRNLMRLSRADVGVTGATTLAGLTFLLALTLLLGSLL